MPTIAMYPGSFDPVTNGHLDIIKRSSRMFDKVIVAVLVNSAKKPLFTVEERVAMLRECCKDIPNVEVENWSGLLADFVRSKDAHILVKGVRNCADWELEAQMARINGGICPGLETVLLPASAAYEHFSSTMVREMIRYHQPLEKYVPAPVAEELMRQRG